AKKPCLLPGDDRNRRRLAQPPCRRDRLGWRTAPRLLPAEHAGDTVALLRVVLYARNRVAPRTRIGRLAPKKPAQLRESVRVVSSEWLDPGKAADVDRKTRTRGRHARLRQHRSVCYDHARSQSTSSTHDPRFTIHDMNAVLALEDGTWYRGVAAGAQ